MDYVDIKNKLLENGENLTEVNEIKQQKKELTIILNKYDNALIYKKINMEEKIHELMEQEEEYINDEMDFYERINIKNIKLDEEKKIERANEIKNCPICYNDIDSVLNVCVTSCGHKFCLTCLTRSLKTNDSCPVCRGNIKQ